MTLKSQIFKFYPTGIYNHHMTTTEPWVPRLFHGPDCFTVSTCSMYIVLGSRGYFGVNIALVSSVITGKNAWMDFHEIFTIDGTVYKEQSGWFGDGIFNQLETWFVSIFFSGEINACLQHYGKTYGQIFIKFFRIVQRWLKVQIGNILG